MAAKGFFNRFKFWKRTIDQEDSLNKSAIGPEYRFFKRYEKYVSEIQSIIMWETPAYSVLCVLFVNVLFWMLVSLEWRFYGILSSALLVASVHEAWTGHVWPEISVRPSPPHPNVDPPASSNVVSVSKVVAACRSCAGQYLAWLHNLRAQQPGLFCCLCSLVCSCLLLLGRSLSGLMLVYSLLMSALLGPGLVLKCLPPQLKQTVAQYASCVHQTFAKYSNDASDDEYMPVTTSEDIALLTRASDLHHDTYDSITNPGSSSDMVSGLLMPSHEEDSLGTLSDMEPCAALLPLDPADDSDSNPGDHQIQFQSGHFNGDSSSDEEAFARDLEFAEADERDSAAVRGLSGLLSQAVASNVLGSVGLLANVLRSRQQTVETSRQQPTRRVSTDSDNEDFEIINRDELNQESSSSS